MKKSEDSKKLYTANTYQDEIKICGINACRMLFEKRPQDIVKIYLHKDLLNGFADVLKYCSVQKKAYKMLDNSEELEKLTESKHHEGVCFITKKKQDVTLDDYIEKIKKIKKPIYAVMLDNVENPHNVGAIIRVCANFGADTLFVISNKKVINVSMIRTSEGGYEWVDIVACPDITKALQQLKENGFAIYTTSSHMGRPLSKITLSERSLFVFGSESAGLDKEVMKMGQALLCIPGTGSVESLNVSCAASVILSEMWNRSVSK